MSEFYLPNDYMLGLLSQLQQLQLDLVKAGRSVHVDASVNENLGEDGAHISITVYTEGRICEFSSLGTRQEHDALLKSLRKL